MTSSGHDYDVDGLEARVALDPGCADYPALAELLRRRGDVQRARGIAEAGLAAAPDRLAGRVVLGLALLDAGLEPEAREALISVLEPALAPHRVGDSRAPLVDAEIEAALAEARPEVDEMISANQMAERVLDEHGPFEGDRGGVKPEVRTQKPKLSRPQEDGPSGLFRTETMAGLLDRQGDASGAEAIRRELASISNVGDLADYPDSDGMLTGASTLDPEAKSKRTIETLERWLLNLQRGAS
ncbi:MAG: hypothetical protein P8M78_17790 [Myxococcota bacterium]|nr:hypothetical protein [Myxococcota bacterium]